jgi:transposase
MKQSNTMTRSSIARVKKIKAKVLPPTAMSPTELLAIWQSTVVGMDVHQHKITVAVLPPAAVEPTEVLEIENHPKAVARMAHRLATRGTLIFVYEAGPCGYEIHRQLTHLGYQAVVIAPALVPRRPGDRVKTNRRDATKLAGLYRSGELTRIRVPTREEEAARDLVRAREDMLKDRLRARHRLSKFLLRQGRVHYGTKAWGAVHAAWLRSQQFDSPLLQATFEAYMRGVEEAEARLESLNQQVLALAQTDLYRIPVQYLRCFKGIDTLGAVIALVETQDFRRFPKAPMYMDFTGLVCSEDSSGDRERRGSITKAGNSHLRRLFVEAAWNYRHRDITSRELAKRRQGCPPEVLQIARKAQHRLHRKFWRLVSRGKLNQVAVVAVARELAGFVWALAQQFPQPRSA